MMKAKLENVTATLDFRTKQKKICQTTPCAVTPKYQSDKQIVHQSD
jgi:hypothetical protein